MSTSHEIRMAYKAATLFFVNALNPITSSSGLRGYVVAWTVSQRS